MEGATLTVSRWGEWDYKFRTETPVGDLVMPGGVFVTTKRTLYSPTTHTVGRKDYYDRQWHLGLVREETPLSSPLTVTIGGSGSCIVTNTGRKDLKVGDSFVVVYPTKDDIKSQIESLKLATTKMSHPGLDQSAPLFGGLMATVKTSDSWFNLSESIADEISGGHSELLYNLGGLMAECRIRSDDTPLTYYNQVSGGQAVDPQAISAGLNPNRQDLILKKVWELVWRMEPQVRGMVQQSLLGHSDTIPPGAKFHAFLDFNI